MLSAPLLGPMMAVTLAMCLSYIHLERFRHRVTVRKYAQERYRFHKSDMDGGREDTDYWKIICTLAEENSKVRKAFPTGFSGRIYSHFFMRARDTLVATIGAFVSLTLLLYWTGYLLGYWCALWSCSFMELLLAISYYSLAAMILFIISIAVFGPSVVAGVQKQIQECSGQISKFVGRELQGKAQSAFISTPASS